MGHGLLKALGVALGHIDEEFQFSDQSYLESKNVADRKLINVATWEKLGEEIELQQDGILRVTDLGAECTV